MSLIARKDNEGKKVVPIRLPISVIELLDEYARYVNGDRNYVVTEALKMVFAQDKEFSKAHEVAKSRRTRPGMPETAPAMAEG